MGNTYTGSDVGNSGLRVRESDGSPDVFGVGDIVLTAADFSIVDDGNGIITLSTGAGGGNTLDQSYDEGGAGVGRSIDADSGAVTITVADTDNNEVLTLTQNDVTNNPHTLLITNTGTGDSLSITNSLGEVFTVSDSEVVVNEAGVDMDFRVEDDNGVSYFTCDANDGAGNSQIGFFGQTPAVRQTKPGAIVIEPMDVVPGTGDTDSATVDENFVSVVASINQLTAAFENYGLLA